MASILPPNTSHSQAQVGYHISQQQTMQHPAANGPPPIPIMPSDTAITPHPEPSIKQRLKTLVPIVTVLVLALIIYFVWNASTTSTSLPPTSGMTQQNFGSHPLSTSSNKAGTPSTTDNGNLQIYIVGAVKNPGVYTLPAGARVYALLQAAGGPLARANLVALNLAAKLTDGEEVYVTLIGELPPTYLGGVPGPGSGTPNSNSTGQLVNINTASADELRQNLHVSSTTAQAIVNYRLQNGPYSSVDQLLQVVSKSIYDHIKGLVTIS
ncbi:MAG: ComEA family DNA-binding protein [Chloroflexota bacterium]|nr:ComEA family DNA-binding protein [Chloroflexota bacterium]